MLRTLLRLGAVALMILVSTSRVSADTMFPAIGDRGDASFNDRCPAHQYLIGLAGRAGLYIDQVQIICAPVLANNMHGTKYLGPSRGGNGGNPLEFSCAGDSVASAVQLQMTANNGHVATIALTCVSVQSGNQSQLFFGTHDYQPGSGISVGNVAAPVYQSCQASEFANGFNGHYGTDVNALGLDCADRPAAAVQNAPAPPPAARPIKLTGKPNLVCPQGYVWREASPSDHVCVTPAQRTLAAAQNAAATARVSQTNHAYGPNTCAAGYVWREAYAGDVVCVTPAERAAAKNENAQAPPQIPK